MSLSVSLAGDAVNTARNMHPLDKLSGGEEVAPCRVALTKHSTHGMTRLADPCMTLPAATAVPTAVRRTNSGRCTRTPHTRDASASPSPTTPANLKHAHRIQRKKSAVTRQSKRDRSPMRRPDSLSGLDFWTPRHPSPHSSLLAMTRSVDAFSLAPGSESFEVIRLYMDRSTLCDGAAHTRDAEELPAFSSPPLSAMPSSVYLSPSLSALSDAYARDFAAAAGGHHVRTHARSPSHSSQSSLLTSRLVSGRKAARLPNTTKDAVVSFTSDAISLFVRDANSEADNVFLNDLGVRTESGGHCGGECFLPTARAHPSSAEGFAPSLTQSTLTRPSMTAFEGTGSLCGGAGSSRGESTRHGVLAPSETAGYTPPAHTQTNQSRPPCSLPSPVQSDRQHTSVVVLEPRDVSISHPLFGSLYDVDSIASGPGFVEVLGALSRNSHSLSVVHDVPAFSLTPETSSTRNTNCGWPSCLLASSHGDGSDEAHRAVAAVEPTVARRAQEPDARPSGYRRHASPPSRDNAVAEETAMMRVYHSLLPRDLYDDPDRPLTLCTPPPHSRRESRIQQASRTSCCDEKGNTSSLPDSYDDRNVDAPLEAMPDTDDAFIDGWEAPALSSLTVTDVDRGAPNLSTTVTPALYTDSGEEAVTTDPAADITSVLKGTAPSLAARQGGTQRAWKPHPPALSNARLRADSNSMLGQVVSPQSVPVTNETCLRYQPPRAFDGVAAQIDTVPPSKDGIAPVPSTSTGRLEADARLWIHPPPTVLSHSISTFASADGTSLTAVHERMPHLPHAPRNPHIAQKPTTARELPLSASSCSGPRHPLREVSIGPFASSASAPSSRQRLSSSTRTPRNAHLPTARTVSAQQSVVGGSSSARYPWTALPHLSRTTSKSVSDGVTIYSATSSYSSNERLSLNSPHAVSHFRMRSTSVSITLPPPVPQTPCRLSASHEHCADKAMLRSVNTMSSTHGATTFTHIDWTESQCGDT